jgi:hypothetical protein
LLDGVEFHQVSHLAVNIPFGQVFRLWQRLQEDRGCYDVLACTKLLWELHAVFVDDVVVDPACALMRRTRGFHPF